GDGLNVLVNNAAFRLLGAVEETSLEEAKEVFETNFFGIHRLVLAAVPMMRAAGGGKIVNISSMAGLNGIPFGAIYSASKSAVEIYSEGLRQELKPHGICVCLVVPGVVRSVGEKQHNLSKTSVAGYENAKARALHAIARLDRNGMHPNKVA